MKAMKLIVMLVVASLLCFVCGCLDWDLDLFKTRKYKYKIKIALKGDSFERKLTCSSNVPSGELDRLAELYGTRLDKYSFVDTFTSVPKDINESGSFIHLDTQMGSMSLYTERFLGDDDLASGLERGLRAVDILTDLLIGWFEAELGEDPNFEMLRKFCDKNLRRDMKNMYVYVWGLVPGNRTDEYKKESTIRAYHYLAKRGYFDQIGLPEIVGVWEYSSNGEDKLMKVIQRFIAGKMGCGYADAIPPSLGFLANADTAKASLEKYIRTTNLYKEAWEKKKVEEDNPDAEPPDPLKAVIEESGLLGDFSLVLFADKYTFNVSLSCETGPFSTNGEVDVENKRVTWSRTEYEGANGWDTFFYAVWCVPNEHFQREHLGKVILDGEDLAEYCFWREGLTQEDGQEWDKFLLTLRPGAELPKQIASFRFTSDPQGTIGYAETLRWLIKASMDQTSNSSQTKEGNR